jgi:hypothetical protein
MLRKICRYLADDHRRLDALPERAMSDPENIDAAAYAQFRSGLLKHIGVEEKMFLPRGTKATPRRTASRRAQTAPRSRRVGCAAGPSPTAPVVAAIRVIFNVHNPIEEEPGGMVLEFVLGSMGGRDLRRLRHLSASRSGLDGFGQRRCFHAI